MSDTLFITANLAVFERIAKEFSLKQITPLLFTGQCTNKELSLLRVETNKVDSTLLLTHLLSTNTFSKLVILNPVQCPDSSIPLGKIVIGEDVIEWDKPVLESHHILLTVPEIEDDLSYSQGKVMSGDRLAQNKTTPMMQCKMIDSITYPIARVSQYFNIPVISIGVVGDYCTANYQKALQNLINPLTDKLLAFIQNNLSQLV